MNELYIQVPGDTDPERVRPVFGFVPNFSGRAAACLAVTVDNAGFLTVIDATACLVFDGVPVRCDGCARLVPTRRWVLDPVTDEGSYRCQQCLNTG